VGGTIPLVVFDGGRLAFQSFWPKSGVATKRKATRNSITFFMRLKKLLAKYGQNNHSLQNWCLKTARALPSNAKRSTAQPCFFRTHPSPEFATTRQCSARRMPAWLPHFAIQSQPPWASSTSALVETQRKVGFERLSPQKSSSRTKPTTSGLRHSKPTRDEKTS
jgi:hypothetical protein